MDENQSFTPLNHHGTPLLRILALLLFALVIALVSSLSTYWYLGKSHELNGEPINIPETNLNKTQLTPTATIVPSPTATPPLNECIKNGEISYDWTKCCSKTASEGKAKDGTIKTFCAPELPPGMAY